MNTWEQRVTYPDGRIAPYQQSHNARYYKLTAQKVTHSVTSDIRFEGLGYNGDTPGPLIIARQGDWIILEVENQTDEPNALHVHGLAKPNSQDGMPAIEPTPIIQPGKSYTYQFMAWQAGTFFYHSSEVFQITQGLLGPLIVLPREEQFNQDHIPDHDHVLMLQQWHIPQPELGKIEPGTFNVSKFEQNPNFFTINGKAFPDTSPLYTRMNEKNRIRFINKSSSSHSMHTHGHDFQVVAVDGFARKDWYDDTINVASGQRYDVEFIANNPGRWPINGTKSFHQSNNGVTPGGMITRFIYT